MLATARRTVRDGLGVQRHLAGWRPDRADHRDLVMRTSRLRAVLQPPSAALLIFDVIPVYDQLQEGSCTANMGCAQVRHLEALAGRLGSFLPSRQHLYKATRTLEGTPLAEDSGAQIRDVYGALKTYGVCGEALDPYSDSSDSYSSPISVAAAADALNHRAILYYSCPDLRTIKASILQGFPIGFGFTVYENMMSSAAASTGLVLYPEAGEQVDGGHANLIIGYDDAKKIGNEIGAVLSRNSWGSSWGQSGDLWLPYRYITEGLATDFWTLRSEML